MSLKIAFSAGEFSGDEHLSDILSAIRNLAPDCEFRGLAGPKTRALGIKTELALEDYASVMGFADVLKAAPKILSALSWFKKTFATWKPDLLVIVDYPDFNLKLAKIAKASGAKVIYYIPPKIWIWRSNRIKKIEKVVDRVALIFPFEKEFYEKLDFSRSVYVGHPFHDSLKRESSQELENQKRHDFFDTLSLDINKTTLAFFPGSRPSEIKRFWPGMIAGLNILAKRLPEIQIILSVAPSVKNIINEKLAESDIRCCCIEGKNLEILRFSDLGFVKSGTSNLQAAFYELPFVMYYQASLFSELIVRCFIKIRQFSMVNIIRPGTVIELLQRSATPERIADELESLIISEEKRNKVKSNLKEVHNLLSTYDYLPIFENCHRPAERAAKLGLDLLK